MVEKLHSPWCLNQWSLKEEGGQKYTLNHVKWHLNVYWDFCVPKANVYLVNSASTVIL